MAFEKARQLNNFAILTEVRLSVERNKQSRENLFINYFCPEKWKIKAKISIVWSSVKFPDIISSRDCRGKRGGGGWGEGRNTPSQVHFLVVAPIEFTPQTCSLINKLIDNSRFVVASSSSTLSKKRRVFVVCALILSFPPTALLDAMFIIQTTPNGSVIVGKYISLISSFSPSRPSQPEFLSRILMSSASGVVRSVSGGRLNNTIDALYLHLLLLTDVHLLNCQVITFLECFEVRAESLKVKTNYFIFVHSHTKIIFKNLQ